MQTVNYNVLKSLDSLNNEDRERKLRLNHVLNVYHGKAPSYLFTNFTLKPDMGKHPFGCSPHLHGTYMAPS